jgi:hypothetical protein
LLQDQLDFAIPDFERLEIRESSGDVHECDSNAGFQVNHG